MTASVDSVRIKVHDTVEPYVYSDNEVTAALSDAVDWLDIRAASPSCPKYATLQKLVAARYLISSCGTSRPAVQTQIVSATEEGNTVTFAQQPINDTTQMQVEQLTAEIDQYLSYCKGNSQRLGGIGAVYDNY